MKEIELCRRCGINKLEGNNLVFYFTRSGEKRPRGTCRSCIYKDNNKSRANKPRKIKPKEKKIIKKKVNKRQEKKIIKKNIPEPVRVQAKKKLKIIPDKRKKADQELIDEFKRKNKVTIIESKDEVFEPYDGEIQKLSTIGKREKEKSSFNNIEDETVRFYGNQ